jgi:hypothetical protein
MPTYTIITGKGSATYTVSTGARGPAGTGGASVWGTITGTLSDQTDLQAALNAISSSGVQDGNKGSITVASSGTVWTINSGAITNAMLAGSIEDGKISSAATWNAKQDALVSGTNIKTINGESILGSGNIEVSGGDLTSGPVTSSGGVSAIADGALSQAKTTGLVTTLTDLNNHATSTSNPHSVTKSQVGLGSVENTALSTWPGSFNITNLGNVTNGTWNATPIADARIASATTWNAKQAALVSGTNIKTINGESILGSGDITVAGSEVTPTDLSGGTVLTVGGIYFDSFSANRTLTFTGTATDGKTISLTFDASAEVVLTIPTSYRLGDTGTTTSITFPIGNHILKWTRLDGRWYVADSAWEESSTPGDTTPPNLTSVSGTETGTTTATLSATTDEDNGTIYWYVGTEFASPPDASAMVDGTDAEFHTSAAVSSTGEKTANATGLTADTVYQFWVMHRDAANNDSDIENYQYFTTDAADATAPTISSVSPTDNATGVAIANNLTAVFSENVSFNGGSVTGAVVLRKNDGGWIDVESFDLPGDIGTGAGQISISGDTLTINPTADLTNSMEYAVRIASNAIKDGSDNYYGGIANDTMWSFTTAAATSTSYANTGGTGDRQAIITTIASAGLMGGDGNTFRLVNGNMSESNTYFINNLSLSGSVFLRFDFGSGASKVIDEAKFYQQNGTSHGTWKWQGSNNGTDWTDIGSSFTLGGATTQTITALSGNTTGYRYYQIVGVSGVTSNNPYLYEFEFKISA